MARFDLADVPAGLPYILFTYILAIVNMFLLDILLGFFYDYST
jgi:hypothetical protein